MTTPETKTVAGRASRIAALEEHDGVASTTQKLEIGGVDCYLSVAWAGGRVVHLGLVISGGRNKNPLLEVVFAHALALIDEGRELADVLSAWRGTRFEPAGVCPQLGGIVGSPLDAVARWFDGRTEAGHAAF